MADTNKPAAQAEVKPPHLQVLGQYIRDMSFENVAAQKNIDNASIQPNVQVQVNLDARQREAADHYEVLIKLNIESKNKDNNDRVFILEIEYAGVFVVQNVPADQLHPFLLIECPRMIFPYLRRIVGDITRDGGFPPLNLENIDFLALYRGEMARRAELEKAGKPIS